ncbi:hypothetical protein [Bacillus mycoides]|uniref:hypothetical protein n=1 Tax=Bacillus mycoides TaxID=1405 RepID=UPI003CFDE991
MVTATTVKVVRMFLNINQSELAKRVISTIMVSEIEKWSKRITPNFIKRFKRAVGIRDTISIDIVYIYRASKWNNRHYCSFWDIRRRNAIKI